MRRRRQGLAALAALAAAAVALLVVELFAGALDFGEWEADDPCDARVASAGDGFQAVLQRIVLDGLNGAACELGTTREQLVLSFDPELGAEVDWDRETAERALRAGLENAVDEAEAREGIGGTEALILREIVRRSPLDLLLEGGASIADLFGRLSSRDYPARRQDDRFGELAHPQAPALRPRRLHSSVEFASSTS